MRGVRTARKIEVHSIHALQNSKAVDYESLADILISAPAEQRLARFGNRIVVITEIRKIGDRYFFTFVEGEEGVEPLILDLGTGETRIEELRPNELLGTAAHALIDFKKRRASIEYVKSGPKALQMAAAFEQILAPSFDGRLQFSFAPVVGPNFISELERFQRIRVATISLIRPNAGWDDHYTAISDLLDKSGGEKADLSVKAGRGDSLSREDGIIEVIKDAAADNHAYMLDAEVIGVRENEEAETRLPLSNHTVSRTITLQKERDGSVNAQALLQKMTDIMGTPD